MKNVEKLEYKIRVETTPAGPKPKLFYGSTHLPDGEVIRHFNKNKDGLRKVGHYRVGFEIEDFSQSPIRFVPRIEDAMWVQFGSECPISPCALPSEIWVDSLHPGGKRIEVINMDMTVGEFWFTLNFCDKSITNPTPADYIMLDPGGINQNTGGAGSEFQSYALVGAVSGAMAGLVSTLLVNRGLLDQNLLLGAIAGSIIGLAVGWIFKSR